jgi:hypothetical protein
MTDFEVEFTKDILRSPKKYEELSKNIDLESLNSRIDLQVKNLTDIINYTGPKVVGAVLCSPKKG